MRGGRNMKFELKEITIREIVEGYSDNGDEGVIGYNGKLNIRPPYQREFIYNDVRKKAVVYSIRRDFPLNVMYWIQNAEGMYEILDGQQRTVSLCQFYDGAYPIVVKGKEMYFNELPDADKKQFLDYKLMVYFCEGNDKGKISWFRIINIAGEKMTDQELRNAIYVGDWLIHAKRLFSKNDCDAYLFAKDYVGGSLIRQELLEKAISWVSGGEIEKYMSIHQNDPNADELWEHFKNVIEWVKRTFIVYRKIMKEVEWGVLYDKYKYEQYDPKKLEAEISALMKDVDVTDKKGVYRYVLSRDKKFLNV
jgi:hypothetical protein